MMHPSCCHQSTTNTGSIRWITAAVAVLLVVASCRVVDTGIEKASAFTVLRVAALGCRPTTITTTTTPLLLPWSFLVRTGHYDAARLPHHHSCRRCGGGGSGRRRVGTSGMTNANDDDDDDDSSNNNDIDGAELAAAFFRTAQSKGICMDSNDLLDDEEEEEEEDEEDDDDDDEIEPNIPQGAINAFLGYDTGNVGEKLAGNVTLTNDQLYSEVKERVLESAGGFVSFVQGATDDDDDDEEDDDDDEDRKLFSTANPPYVVPTTVPDSELTAGEVVLLVLEALRNNDTPTPNRGVEILFGYSSPGSQIRNQVGLTPAEYADFLKETEYKILFDNNNNNSGPISIDKADYSLDGKRAFFTARWTTTNVRNSAPPQPLDTVAVNFILSTTGREDDACWLIDSLLIRPQSMRRRRRK